MLQAAFRKLFYSTAFLVCLLNNLSGQPPFSFSEDFDQPDDTRPFGWFFTKDASFSEDVVVIHNNRLRMERDLGRGSRSYTNPGIPPDTVLHATEFNYDLETMPPDWDAFTL